MSHRTHFVDGLRAAAPLLIGVAPFGMIYGVLAVGAGIPPLVAQAMSVIVFAGSAQFVTAQLVAGGMPALVIIATGFVLNLRHVLYSASVAPYLKPLSRPWKWLLAYVLTDEAYALVITRLRHSATGSQWFFLGAGFSLWGAWQVSTAVGIFLGAQAPASWSLDFTLPLTFIALVVPNLKDRAAVTAALVAGVVAVLALGLPFKLGLMVAMVVGIIAGLVAEGP